MQCMPLRLGAFSMSLVIDTRSISLADPVQGFYRWSLSHDAILESLLAERQANKL
jgi:hypothetical protein